MRRLAGAHRRREYSWYVAGEHWSRADLEAEIAGGCEIWRLIFEFVRNLSEVISRTLPSFWKVAKGYMEGKYQKVLPWSSVSQD